MLAREKILIWLMTLSVSPPRHRFPVSIISQAV